MCVLGLDVFAECENTYGASGSSKVLEQNVDTSTSAGKVFFGMLSVFAQLKTT